MSQIAEGRSVLLDAVASAAEPRRALSCSEWADAHRRLSGKASSEAGQWRTDRTPYLREPLDCFSARSPVREVVMMFSAQVGKTETGLNFIGYVMAEAPGPMLVVLPTLEVRKRWSLQRLGPMLRETPVLAEMLEGYKSRDASNSEDIKDYPGGFLVLGGANSSSSLRSMPIRYVLCDELDEFPASVGAGLDPVDLIEQRTVTFRRYKKAYISTPTVKDASRIEGKWLQSDMRRYHLPCPHCGELITLKWENLKWNEAVTQAWYVCAQCGSEIGEQHKTAMLAGGRWIAEHPERSERGVRGYHLNALYAPIGLGQSWLELAQEWKIKHGDPARLKTFINEKLGEPWEDRSHTLTPKQLMARVEDYAIRSVPPGALILTAGVDVQDDRLAVQILGWGREETCWVIDWVELPGNPGKQETWDKLTEYLGAPLINAWGNEMKIRATGIDTGGHFTHEVYLYCRSRAIPRAVALKGASTPGKPVLPGRPSAQDINWRGKVIKGGVNLWLMGADTAKHVLYRRLEGDARNAPEQRRVRFSGGLPEEYFEQLIAEVFDPAKNRWVLKRGQRNEALDTWNLGYAAAMHPEIRVHAKRQRDWDDLERLLQGAAPAAAMQAPESAAAPQPAPERKKLPMPAPRAGGFVNKW